jgi:hypothetical protein
MILHRRSLRVLPLLVLAALAGCGEPRTVTSSVTPPPGVQPVVLEVCDDGGDGGVLIDGICL